MFLAVACLFVSKISEEVLCMCVVDTEGLFVAVSEAVYGRSHPAGAW